MDDLTRAWRFIEEAQQQLTTASSSQLKRYWAYTLSNAEQHMDVIIIQMLDDSSND